MNPARDHSDPLAPEGQAARTAIEVNGLTKRFGDVIAVDDLSFTVLKGTVTGFLGPNGAGKTTTLRILLGLVEPSAGSATIGGQSYRDLPDPLHHAGAVLDSSSFYPGRTARNHLRVHAAAGDLDLARIDVVLDVVGLEAAAGRRVGSFSLGMRQRLGLATALLGDPKVLILDEPANGLDPEGVRWLRQLLRGFADAGRTVLVSSHILAEVAQTVDTVVIVDRGRMVAHAPLKRLMAAAKVQPVVRIRTSKLKELSAAVVADGAQAQVIEPDLIEVTGSTPERVGQLAADAAIPVFESITTTGDLESIFLKLTSGDGPEGRR